MYAREETNAPSVPHTQRFRRQSLKGFKGMQSNLMSIDDALHIHVLN